AGNRRLRGGDLVWRVDADQLREGLGNLCSAREQGPLALRQVDALSGNESAPGSSKGAGRNPDGLKIRNMQHIRLIRDRGEVSRTFAHLLLLALYDPEPGDL